MSYKRRIFILRFAAVEVDGAWRVGQIRKDATVTKVFRRFSYKTREEADSHAQRKNEMHALDEKNGVQGLYSNCAFEEVQPIRIDTGGK